MPIKPSKIQEQFYKRLKEGQYKAAENLIKKVLILTMNMSILNLILFYVLCFQK
jgi:hypothetical protein